MLCIRVHVHTHLTHIIFNSTMNVISSTIDYPICYYNYINLHCSLHIVPTTSTMLPSTSTLTTTTLDGLGATTIVPSPTSTSEFPDTTALNNGQEGSYVWRSCVLYCVYMWTHKQAQATLAHNQHPILMHTIARTVNTCAHLPFVCTNNTNC